MSTSSHFALVTGATHGIGLELARLLARGGYDIVAVARDDAALKELRRELSQRYDTQVRILVQDLANQSAAEKVWDFTQKHKIELDVLVNNAGFGDFGEFTDSDWDKQAKMINLNIFTLTYLCRLYAPGMAARGRGRILNLASAAAFLPGPLMSVYHASKWFVRSFSASFREELRGTGVSVTTLYPGPTATGFQAAAKQEQVKVFADAEHMGRAYEVAQAGYEAMMDGRASAIPGLGSKLASFFSRLLPDTWLAWGIHRIYRL